MRSKLQPYLNKKNCIGIIGAGASGQGVAALCRKFSIPYEILEEHKDEIFTPCFKKYGICVFSPGFPPYHPWWRQAQEAGCLCINEIDFAALFTVNPFIAVTGTNGKTSTVELITQVFNAWGKKACAVGNNGNVLSLEVAKNEADTSKIYVCEISSYQAWPLKFFKPRYTLWTNFAPDHILYHGNLNNYFSAKKHLLECTQEACFCGHTLEHDLPDLAKVNFAQNPQLYTNWLDNFPVCFSYGQRENFTLVRFFAEKIGIGEIFTYSFNMINKMNDMASGVLQNIIDEKMSDEEKVLTVYQYVIDHLIYDHEELRKRKEFVLSTKGNFSTYENKYKYINSSYEAFMSGRVICEGYVNMLNFLLNKLNIESRTVYSNVKGSSDYIPGVYNHAANAIKINNEWYFFDSQLEENSCDLKFFKKTEEEFRKTHDISLSVQLPKQKIKIK